MNKELSSDLKVPKIKKSTNEYEHFYAFLDEDLMSIITISRKKDGGVNIFANQINKINADLLRYVSDFLKEIENTEKEKRKKE